MKKFLILIILIISLPAMAAHKYLEKDYQNLWCSQNNGQTEVKLPDGTRIDCLTKEYAIEFDFASKWAESIGQSLYYGLSTNKQPAVVLIMENRNDTKYLKRLQTVSKMVGIKVFTMDYYELEK